jgi:VCBS repeat-containing protein
MHESKKMPAKFDQMNTASSQPVTSALRSNFLQHVSIGALLLLSAAPAVADITDGKFSSNQIFDVQYNWVGSTLNASGFQAPFDSSFAHPNVAAGDYYKLVATATAGSYALVLYDSSNAIKQTLHASGTISAIGADAIFYLGGGFFGLADGATTTVTVDYEVTDGTSSTAASVSWAVTGVNDAPVSAAVTGTVTEDDLPSALDALNATDPDAGDTLYVTNVGSLPQGVTYDAATSTFTLDPADAIFQSLNTGESTTVTVSYDITDGITATTTSVSWTVLGLDEVQT